MSKPSVLLTVRQVEASLNRALAEYEASSDADTKEFYLLKVQTFIFYYDVLAAMVSIGRNNPKGFAQAVALKSLVHSLYEYDHQMNRTLLPRIMRYASRRRKPVDTRAVKAERGKWRDHLARLRTWKAVRDAATGHYGKDIEHQIRLIKTIDQEEVLSVASAFVDYTASSCSYFPIGDAVTPNHSSVRSTQTLGDESPACHDRQG